MPAPASRDADVAAQRTVVDAFLAAARDGDFEALVAVLDPEVVLRSDTPGGPVLVTGAREVMAWPGHRDVRRAGRIASSRSWSTG